MNIKVSLAENLLNNILITTELSDIFNRINTDNNIKSTVTKLRELKQNKPSKFDETKKTLPAFCGSVFENNIRKTANFTQASIMVFDLDYLTDIEAVYSRVKSCEDIFAAFISPSGAGLKIITSFDKPISDVATFKKIYEYLRKHFEDILGVPLDHTSDPTRLCFLSHDTVYQNQSAILSLDDTLLDILQHHTIPIRLQDNNLPNMDRNDKNLVDDFSVVTQIIESLTDKKVRLAYKDWFKVGCYIAGTFGENGRELFVNYSLSVDADDTVDSLNNQYDNWIDYFDDSINIDTILKIAANHEISICQSLKSIWYVSEENIKIDEFQLKLTMEQIGLCYLKISDDCLIMAHIIDTVINPFNKSAIFSFIYGHFDNYDHSYLVDTKTTDDGKEIKITIRHILQALTKQIRKAGVENIATQLKVITYNPFRSSSDGVALFFKNRTCIVKKGEVSYDVNRKDLVGKKHLWKSQITQFDFEYTEGAGDFERFVYLTTLSKDLRGKQNEIQQTERFRRIMQCLGFLLCDRTDPTFNRIIVFMDLNLKLGGQGGAGGSGKGLISEGLSKLRSLLVIDGKKFTPKQNFALQNVDLSNQIIHISDAAKNMDVESMYNYVTDCLEIEKKYKGRIIIPKSQLPKFLISANHAIVKDSSSSTRRRFIEFYFGDYFDADWCPSDEFSRPLFSENWTDTDWNQLFSFFVRCIGEYLNYGIIDEVISDKVKYHKLSNLTLSQPFLDWACGEPESENFLSLTRIKTGLKYDKSMLFLDFQSHSQKMYGIDQPKFTSYLKAYAYCFDLEVNESHSGNTNYIAFYKATSDGRLPIFHTAQSSEYTSTYATEDNTVFNQ